MKKTSIKELRSFSKAELIRYVQYVEGEPLRAHHTAARTYIYELRLERVNKRYDAAVKKLSSLTQGDKTLQGLVEWTKAHETVSRCIAELERLGKTALWLAVRLRPSAGWRLPAPPASSCFAGVWPEPGARQRAGDSFSGGENGQGQVLWMPLPTMPVAWGREPMSL